VTIVNHIHLTALSYQFALQAEAAPEIKFKSNSGTSCKHDVPEQWFRP
jgi:hypothetical protein